MLMVFMLFTFIFCVIAPAASASTTGQSGVGSEIYSQSNGTELNKSIKSVISTVGSIGAGLFTLAVLIIAIILMFGSLSPKMTGTYWKALFLCAAAAFVFFGAYKFSAVIAGIAQAG